MTVLSEKEDKETFHLEFELPETGMEYTVGDSLGVIATNLDIEVDLVIKELGVQDSYEVKALDLWKHRQLPSETSVKQALTYCYDLKNPTPQLLQLLLKNSEKLPENGQTKKLKQLMGRVASINSTFSNYSR